jgi:hypothetical protein
MLGNEELADDDRSWPGSIRRTKRFETFRPQLGTRAEPERIFSFFSTVTH